MSSHSKKTPYQGRRRTFGYFCCRSCKRTWNSGNSWANRGQKCKRCWRMIYPHIQRPLKRPTKKEKKPHLMDLCGMCEELEYSCRLLTQQPRRQRQ
ncbi:Zinc finger CCHC domain-containing protein 24 [Geodia barretti]|uniref:Zinc finger CCHC domain-containing protein 24 n=1 Tax=Geodia barretti TaxID=519541 RepID=A0AA35U3Y9_GEOBA|nr:Zinc finger CCHC domain-containing protein 24 [Geodia barretti]